MNLTAENEVGYGCNYEGMSKGEYIAYKIEENSDVEELGYDMSTPAGSDALLTDVVRIIISENL